jgi:DNA-binding NtrC family response regulator
VKEGQLNGRQILIIDDDAKLRYSLSMVLGKAGYTVAEANGAKEAVEALTEKSFDLVFLDLKMPGIDGMQLLPEILHMYPGIPVVILTGSGSLETAEKAITWGVRGYLLKPIGPLEIIERVSKILQEERLLRKKGKIYEELKGLLYEMQPDV